MNPRLRWLVEWLLNVPHEQHATQPPPPAEDEAERPVVEANWRTRSQIGEGRVDPRDILGLRERRSDG